jgi:S-DNA-T family DNA segregation ATPase FtsK/SpoIIIE
MDTRICFRVRERKDVDLILGQGMLSAGWHAHKLNAPGKFLVSAPEHDTPKPARAYLVTDQAVNDTAARHSGNRPQLDEISRNAISPADETDPNPPPENDSDQPGASQSEKATAEDSLMLALCRAPEEGAEVGELLNITGMPRPTLYRYLRQYAKAGRATQVSRGRWRATTTEEPSP